MMKIMEILSKALLIVSLIVSAQSMAAKASGKAAPDFTLKALDGKNVRLAELKGDIVVVNFWASWCGPCRKEMPILDALASKYKDLGVKVIGVNVEQDNSAAHQFLTQTPVNFTIVFDPTSKVSEAYQVEAMPTTVIIDRDGNMRYLHKGYQTGYEALYAKELKALIRE